MKLGLGNACNTTGFVDKHAAVCEGVANTANAIILFREPGKMAQGLIEEQYSMKGFRIDTKSCDWGPMAGFVCMDSRLTKDPKYSVDEKNVKWTNDALSGHIEVKFFGENVNDPDWVADVMPIAISRARIDDLTKAGKIAPRPDGLDFIGESKATNGTTVLGWRLVMINNASGWANGGYGYYVVCINNKAQSVFRQEYAENSAPVWFCGNEAILGLTNPGTKDRGFKACVTADYDLFSIWPKTGNGDVMSNKFNVMAQVTARAGQYAPLPGGVARMATVDTRLKSAGFQESHRFGDVSARVMTIKTMLNSALQGAGVYDGGNAVHHNDEAGNFALAKGALAECLPLIGFFPTKGTVLIESLADFKELVTEARKAGFEERCKPEWLREAGVS